MNLKLLLFFLLPLSVFAQTPNYTGITINLEGTLMYYTAENNGSHLLYKAQKNSSGVWEDGVPVDAFNKHIDNYVVKTPFISYDGQTLYFSSNASGSNGFDIYFSQKQGNEWTKPSKVLVINSEKDEISPTVSADNQTIYFARSNDEGYNIYVSHAENSGVWSFPRILPLPITAGCENSVYVSPLGETLLFSSDRPSERRRKRYDIYYSTNISGELWLPPTPSKDKVEEYNEFSPVLDNKSDEIFAIRGVEVRPVYSLHSYEAPRQILNRQYSILKGVVKNQDGKPIKSEITLRNNYNYSITAKSASDPVTGEYTLVIPNDGLYSIGFNVKESSQALEIINTENNSQQQLLEKDITIFENAFIDIEIKDALFNRLIDADVKVYEKTKTAKVSKMGEGKYRITTPIIQDVEIELYKDYYIKEILNIQMGELVEFPQMHYNIKLKPDLRSGEISVKQMSDNKGMAADIFVTNMDIKENVSVILQDTGFYEFNIRKDCAYSISVFAKGHTYFYTIWHADASRVKQTLEVKPVLLQEISRIPMPYLKFHDGESYLTTEAMGELSCVVNVLKDNSEYSATIIMYHTGDENNLKLVQQRAKNVKTYLNTESLTDINFTIKLSITDKPKDSDIEFALK